MRYNLPLNDNYTIIDSYYTGGLENGCTCDNCNKPIANVAEIQNAKGIRFNVGMDCAKTLSNLQGLYSLECEFAELKGLMAKVNKEKKENPITFEIASNGSLGCKSGNNWIFTKEIEYSKKYLRMYLNQVVNPEKIGYIQFKTDIDLGFNNFTPRTDLNFVHKLTVNDFDCIISVKPYFHGITGAISGYDFFLEIPEINYSDRVCMYTQIKTKIEYQINKYYFSLFHN